MTAPAAILASSVSIRSLADGTLRLSVDIEPNDAQAAFALFGKPGSPVAIVRVTNEAAVSHDRRQQAQATERKPLSLASKVALTCQQRSFAEFLCRTQSAAWKHAWHRASANDECAALVVRSLCGVSSRSEIVEGSKAAEAWWSLEADYLHWQRQGEAA